MDVSGRSSGRGVVGVEVDVGFEIQVDVEVQVVILVEKIGFDVQVEAQVCSSG
jgi:hypothetical protein